LITIKISGRCTQHRLLKAIHKSPNMILNLQRQLPKDEFGFDFPESFSEALTLIVVSHRNRKGLFDEIKYKQRS